MRYSFHIALVLLVMLVTGCGGAYRYDSRLAAADSLMHDLPDSALAIVEAVDPASLAREGDRAYHDLLLTQARYRCYITATSDSDINRALNYYRRHDGEREKLTRAYIYKGAVMEELGHPDSAMLYYKHAEATAAPTDYFNLGQINTRIGSLYRIYYADKLICYDKYKKALMYYRAIGDKKLELNSLYNMGMCSGITRSVDSKPLLDAAAALALELNDSSVYYESREMVVRQFIMKDTNMIEAKQIALHLFHDYSDYLTYDIIIDLSSIYVKEHQLDSAKYYIRHFNLESPSISDAPLKNRICSVLSDIAMLEGNPVKRQYYLDSCKYLSDSISNNKQKYRIQLIENEKNNEQLALMHNEWTKHKWVIWIAVLLLLIPIVLLVIYQQHKILTVNSLLREIKKVDVDKHESFLQKLHNKESAIEHLTRNMVEFIQTTIDSTEHDAPSITRRRIKESIGIIATNEEFWQQLRTFLDKNHNNIITELSRNPRINNTDIRFIELVCCGFSYVEIAITLGYSPNYVSNKRIKIQKKLGIKKQLNEYLNELMKI